MNPLHPLGLRTTFTHPSFAKTAAVTEEFFGTEVDSTQIPINQETRNKFLQLSPYCMNTAEDTLGNPVSWVICIPTSVELMEKFISEKITEKELFDQTEIAEHYSALYLCTAFTIPAYRKKGIARALLLESIQKFKETNPDIQLFAWGYSAGGQKVIDSLPFEIIQKKVS